MPVCMCASYIVASKFMVTVRVTINRNTVNDLDNTAQLEDNA